VFVATAPCDLREQFDEIAARVERWLHAGRGANRAIGAQRSRTCAARASRRACCTVTCSDM